MKRKLKRKKNNTDSPEHLGLLNPALQNMAIERGFPSGFNQDPPAALRADGSISCIY